MATSDHRRQQPRQPWLGPAPREWWPQLHDHRKIRGTLGSLRHTHNNDPRRTHLDKPRQDTLFAHRKTPDANGFTIRDLDDARYQPRPKAVGWTARLDG